MKPRYWIALVLFALFGACTYRFLGGLRTDVYQGQVVDAETSRPISEAVVTVVWYRAGFGLDSHPLSLLNAQETVTDANGRFSLNVSSGLDWNPLSERVDKPSIVVYKPGYEPLWEGTIPQYGFQNIDTLVTALEAEAIIQLRTLEAVKISSRQYTDEGAVLPGTGGNLPRDRIPHLMRAINRQRQIAQMQTFPGKFSEGNTK